MIKNHTHNNDSGCNSSIYALRFVNFEDGGWFTKTMTRVVQEEFGDEITAFIEPTNYFVDFMR